MSPAEAPELGLRIDLDRARVVEDDGAPTRVRVVLSLDRPAGPVILRRISAGDARRRRRRAE